MRNMFMCVMMFLFITSEGVSQATTVETLVIKTYDEKNQLINNVTYEGEQAIKLDVAQLIKENQSEERITVRGLFYNDLDVTKIYFDSKYVDDFHTAEYFCEKETFTLKPYLGVGGQAKDDMKGVTIERVVETSPAGQAGVLAGDVILTFNYLPMESFCDLKLEVEANKVGAEIPMEIIRNGKQFTQKVTLGGQKNNTIHFSGCDRPTQERASEKEPFVFSELNVYPNPTTDFVNLKFISTSAEPIKFYVLNFNGAIIHKENVSNQAGMIKLSYAFANEPDGTYLFVIEQDDKLFEKHVIYAK